MGQLTINQVEEAMLKGVDPGKRFKDIYWEELIDCVDDLIEWIKLKAPGGLTKAMIDRNGYKSWKVCLAEAPGMKDDFCRTVLDAWVKFFFDYHDIMELVGIIAEQENPGADPSVIQEMKALKTGGLILKSTEKGPLTGLHVVFTGKSEYFVGEDVERFLEKNGAYTSHTVTKATELLITGSRPSGSKLVKAGRLGIRVIKESELIEMNRSTLKGLPR